MSDFRMSHSYLPGSMGPVFKQALQLYKQKYRVPVSYEDTSNSSPWRITCIGESMHSNIHMCIN